MSVPATAYPRLSAPIMNPPGTLKPRPYPPLPPWSNLQFQASGSQTSNLISESAVGRETPDTRQKAGTATAEPSGGVNWPAATGVARVMVVLFPSARLARLLQGCAALADVDATAVAQNTVNITERLIGVSPGGGGIWAQQQQDAWLVAADACASGRIAAGGRSRLRWPCRSSRS